MKWRFDDLYPGWGGQGVPALIYDGLAMISAAQGKVNAEMRAQIRTR